MFKPVIRSRTNVLDAKERGDQFVNPPVHPEYPVFDAPTDNGGAHYPLKMGGGGQSTPTVIRRGIDFQETSDAKGN